ncbi:MAG: hypothetical protein V4612_00940 [Pseudomonadota bacterium]
MTKLSKALNNLGFRSQNHSSTIQSSDLQIHQAIIENLYFAGYFNEQLIWQAINLIGFDKNSKKTNQIWSETPQLAFLLMYKIIKKSGALQDNPKLFDSKYLLNHLFDENIFDIQDIEDFMVYLVCQNAFGRIPNQERSEIVPQVWMQIYQQQYLENAQKIGLIAAINPNFTKYDESWVMGAGRYRTTTRIKHLKQLIDSGIDVGKIRLLSGNRELWVEIDNIGDVAEAKNFMIKLAEKNHIKIDTKNPFITRNVLDSPRTYINYRIGETKKLTETLMMCEIYENIFGKSQATLIDDTSKKHRPTTQSTVENIAKYIFQNRFEEDGDLKNKPEVKVMIVSNQPYCERQKLTTKRVVEKIIHHHISKKIIFDEVGGSAFNSAVKSIHSEFAALMAEKFWQYTKKTAHSAKRKRTAQRMIFSARFKDISFIPPIPTSIIPSISYD